MESSTANQITTPGNQNFFLSPSSPCRASTKPSALTSSRRNLQLTSPAASVIPQARSASCVISSATILKNALLSSVCHNADPNPLPPAIASVIWRVAKQQPVSLHLDAHIPPGKGPFPAVILVHGGGWTAGSKTANFAVPLFEPLTKTGYTWFTIDYRLAPQHPHPAAVEEVESVIVFVKKHAREYKVNPKRIALMGESAGGHLAKSGGSTL